MFGAVHLTQGAERIVQQFHPWIFSGAIHRVEEPEAEFVRVFSSKGEEIALGIYNHKSNIALRLLSFTPVTDPALYLKERIEKIIRERSRYLSKDNTAVRLFNGEGDLLPGFVADWYGCTLVVQVTTRGFERLLPQIIPVLQNSGNWELIIERSISGVRTLEGLEPVTKVWHGEFRDLAWFKENGLEFAADLLHGQKTGFFLDQKEMRLLLRNHSRDRTVLNCFSYSGGFSVSALAGGANQVVSVDSSKRAMELLQGNLTKNGFGSSSHEGLTEDVFDWLSKDQRLWDIVVLDPPAFAKKRGDSRTALRGYARLQKMALRKIAPRGLLFTFSCSHFISENDFEQSVLESARATGKPVTVLSRVRNSADHAHLLSHPEGRYLKGLVLQTLV